MHPDDLKAMKYQRVPSYRTSHLKRVKSPGFRQPRYQCRAHPSAQIRFCHKHRFHQYEWCTKCWKNCPRCDHRYYMNPLTPPKRQFAMSRTRPAREQPAPQEDTDGE